MLRHAPREQAPSSFTCCIQPARATTKSRPSIPLNEDEISAVKTAVWWSSRPGLSAQFQANCK